MINSLGLKYPLSCQIKAGLSNLNRLNLKVESSLGDDIENVEEFAELLISAHAPVTIGDMRLNYGATDKDFRNISINQIIAYIDAARRYPHVKQINMHPGPKRWLKPEQTQGRIGDYQLMIEAIRTISSHAQDYGLEIVVENNNAYWAGIPDSVEPDQIDWSTRNMLFGSSPEEWIEICEDVDMENVGLCLDSSHICTHAHTIPDKNERVSEVMKFLAKPQLIKHVHWNDNYIYDYRGRNDSHAVLGSGELPLEFHRTIKSLNATLLIEHFYTIEDLESELRFIRDL